MVLVDTSAWIECLRGTDSPYTTYVRDAILANIPLAWTEPILYELTAGARSPRRADDLRALLLRGPILAVEGLQDWEVATQLYRSALLEAAVTAVTPAAAVSVRLLEPAFGILWVAALALYTLSLLAALAGLWPRQRYGLRPAELLKLGEARPAVAIGRVAATKAEVFASNYRQSRRKA